MSMKHLHESLLPPLTHRLNYNYLSLLIFILDAVSIKESGGAPGPPHTLYTPPLVTSIKVLFTSLSSSVTKQCITSNVLTHKGSLDK